MFCDLWLKELIIHCLTVSLCNGKVVQTLLIYYGIETILFYTGVHYYNTQCKTGWNQNMQQHYAASVNYQDFMGVQETILAG